MKLNFFIKWQIFFVIKVINGQISLAQSAVSGGGGGGGGSGGGSVGGGQNGYFSYLRCWRCDYDDPEQCVKNFDFTKHKHEACDGKCLKAFEKIEARTKVEIDKAQRT